MQTILIVLATFFSWHGARIVYSQPSPIVSSSWPETVMARPTKEGTYRFSAYVETQPSPGCEYDSTVDLVLSWVRIATGPKSPQGLSGWRRDRVTIRKDGQVIGAEIPDTVFHARAGSRISYHVEYSAGRGCEVRPAYQVFPVLEQMR